MKSFKVLVEELVNENYDSYPADEMTMSELRIAINAAKNILDMFESGARIQRWQISAIVKASDELASVCTNIRADLDAEMEDEEEWLNGYDDEDEAEGEYVGYEYPSMYGEEADYKVSVDGLPDMYVKANNPSEVKTNLRKIVKNPDMIRSVDRVTQSVLKNIFRDKAAGKEEEAPEKSSKSNVKLYNKS